MAKIDIDNINGQFASQQGLNNRFDLIEDELNNKVLYRDNPTGEPNQMEQDIDLNTHNIVNAGAIYAKAFIELDGDGVALLTAAEVSYDDTVTGIGGVNLQDVVEILDTTVNTNTQSSQDNEVALGVNSEAIQSLRADLDTLSQSAAGTGGAANIDYALMSIVNTDWATVYSTLSGSVGSKTGDFGVLAPTGFTVERVTDNRLSWSAGSASNDFGVL